MQFRCWDCWAASLFLGVCRPEGASQRQRGQQWQGLELRRESKCCDAYELHSLISAPLSNSPLPLLPSLLLRSSLGEAHASKKWELPGAEGVLGIAHGEGEWGEYWEGMGHNIA